ncbi:MAG: DUF58 domain-containing protein [Akkermansiaceae bacterium]
MATARPSPLFLRLIYRIYHGNSAVAHFFSHRVRPAGILLIIIIPISWTLMPMYSLGPVYQLRGMIFAMLTVGILWLLFRKARVRVTRRLPRMATAGEPLEYHIQIHNTGKRTLAGVNFLEMAPDNRPGRALFGSSREPGEEQRNLFDRTLCYYRWEWLQKGLTLFTGKPSEFIKPLGPGSSTKIPITLTPKKRGVIMLKDLRILLPDPLGIFQRCCRTDCSEDKLIVLPHRYQIAQIDLPGNARFQLGGEALSNTIGQSGDFTSVRDYRPGDPLRHIHWRSWARTGKPIVKEYEDVFFPRYGLILDTFVPAEQAGLFEEAVSVAASFAASIDTNESLLDLMFIHDEAFVFSSGRGEDRIESILEVLAGVSCEPRTDFEALQNVVLQYSDELTASICVFTGWCENRRDTVERFQRAGMELKVFAICHSLEEADELMRLYPSPVAIHWLRADHVEADLSMNVS